MPYRKGKLFYRDIDFKEKEKPDPYEILHALYKR